MNIKSFTDIGQSKKLSGILPLDSADHCFLNDGTAIKAEINSYNVALQLWKDHCVEIIPAWSLSALLGLMPFQIIKNNRAYAFGMVKGFNKNGETYAIKYTIFNTTFYLHITDFYNNSIDAVVDMIYKLKEDGIL